MSQLITDDKLKTWLFEYLDSKGIDTFLHNYFGTESGKAILKQLLSEMLKNDNGVLPTIDSLCSNKYYCAGLEDFINLKLVAYQNQLLRPDDAPYPNNGFSKS